MAVSNASKGAFMLPVRNLGKNVELLRQDANKMIEDLGRLQADLVQEGREVTTTTAQKLADVAQARLAETKRQLQNVDETLHKKPYSYYALGGAFTLGILGGIMLPLTRKIH
jgi:ElaB/YqjD/DUF883 family membrane-anchored ribosome-binding protein